MILVDSSVWIDFFNGNEGPETRRLEMLLDMGETVCVTQIILMEVLQGFRRDRDFRVARRHLGACDVIPPAGDSTFVDAASMYRLLRSKGITIRSSIDCLIACIAMEHRAVILHRDRDYPHIAGRYPLLLLENALLTNGVNESR